MSINLDDVKKALRVTHDDDDDLLIRLIGSATREAYAYIDPTILPPVPIESSSEDSEIDVPEDVFNGIVLLVRADYEGDPTKRLDYKAAAENLFIPYRGRWAL